MVTWWSEAGAVMMALCGMVYVKLEDVNSGLCQVKGQRWRLRDKDVVGNEDEICEQLWAISIRIAS